MHTIKGTTGFLGFKRLEKLAHSGENLLGLLRDGKLVAASAVVITGLLQLLDGLRAILKIIEAEGSEGAGDDQRLIAGLEELQAPQLTTADRETPDRQTAGSSRRARDPGASISTCQSAICQAPRPPQTPASPALLSQATSFVPARHFTRRRRPDAMPLPLPRQPPPQVPRPSRPAPNLPARLRKARCASMSRCSIA